MLADAGLFIGKSPRHLKRRTVWRKRAAGAAATAFDAFLVVKVAAAINLDVQMLNAIASRDAAATRSIKNSADAAST
jgi:hypothetical protein